MKARALDRLDDGVPGIREEVGAHLLQAVEGGRLLALRDGPLPRVAGDLLHLLQPLVHDLGIAHRLDPGAERLEGHPAQLGRVVLLHHLVVEVVIRRAEELPGHPALVDHQKIPLRRVHLDLPVVKVGTQVRVQDEGHRGLLGLKGHAVGNADMERLGRRLRRARGARLSRQHDDKPVGLAEHGSGDLEELDRPRRGADGPDEGVEARVLREERGGEMGALVGPAVLAIPPAGPPRRAPSRWSEESRRGPRECTGASPRPALSPGPSRGGPEGPSPAGLRKALRSLRSGAPPGPSARSSRCCLPARSIPSDGASLSLDHCVPKLKPCSWLRSILLKSAVGFSLDASSSM